MRWFAGLFDHLEPATTAELKADMRLADFAPGEDLSRIGDPPDRLYYVREGRVKVWRPTRNGGALTLYYLGPGAPPGLVAIVRDARMAATMTAVTRVESFWWPAAQVRRLLAADAHFAANGMRLLGNALALIADRLEDVTGASAEQQIGRALLRLAGEHADWPDGGADEGGVTIDVSRQDLADLTGTTLYTASRTLSDWDRQGLVESGRRRVVIKDASALAALVDVEE